ncbi:MAG: alpha/beta hydrolase family protein [Alphaproteobacteria bacterium]
MEAFGNLPLIDDVQLSPDGRYFAVLRRHAGARVVVISHVDPAARAEDRGFSFEDGSIEAMSWANSDRLLITIEQHKRAAFGNPERNFTRIVSVSASGGRTKVLFKRRSRFERPRYVQIASWVVGDLPGDPDHVLIPFTDDDGDLDLYKVHVETGHTDIVARGRKATWAWLADSKGERLLRTDIREQQEEVRHLVRLKGRDWREIARHDLGGHSPFDPLAFSHQPNILHVAAYRNGYEALFEYDLLANKMGRLVFAPPQADLSDIGIDSESGKLLSASWVADEPQIRWFGKEQAALQAKIDRSFPSTSVNRITSSTDDGKTHIITTSAPNRPRRYFYFDTEENHAVEIGKAYPDLAGVEPGEVRRITYSARDGLDIPAYLTLPPGAEAENLPLVVLPHGGPRSRDVMTFDYQAQFLASRGYAVLQPQFRGSSGFGLAFARAGEREWGGKMQDDVTDGVKHLIAEGIADPERICIMGGSYGGYAALMGAVKTPGLYRCAISIAGVSDLLKMLRDERKEIFIHYWERHIGDLRGDRDKLIAASPARQAEKIRIPILLIHGEDDLVVPFEHSEEMAEALEDAGKPHRLMKLEGEDHFLTFGKTRITTLREAERFLARHLGAPR